MIRRPLTRTLSAGVMLAMCLLGTFARPARSADAIADVRALLARARFAQADSLARSALAVVPLRTREDSLASSALHDALAESFWRRQSSLPADADSISRRAVDLKKLLYGPDAVECTATLTHRARVLRRLGRTRESLSIMREVMLTQAHGGVSDSALAVSEAATARMYADIAQLDSAQTLDLRALQRRVRSLGPEHTDVGKSYNSVALNHARVGRMADARECYAHARDVFVHAQPVDSTALLRVDENLAGALMSLGRAREAYQVATEAIEIGRRLGGEGPLNENFAAALWDTGRQDSALSVYRKVVRQHAAAGRWSDEARVRMMIADRLARRAPDDEALAHAMCADSLCHAHAAGGVLQAEVSVVLTNILAERGEFERAQIAADAAVAICDSSLARESASSVRATHNAGWVRFARGDAAGALPLELESCRRTVEHLDLWYRAMSEDDALQYDIHSPPFGFAIAASIVANAPSDSGVAALWDVAMATRSLVLNAMARRRWTPAQASPRTDSLVAAHRDVTRTLAGLLLSGGERRAQDVPRISALRSEAVALERALAAQARPWIEQQEALGVDHASLVSALDPGQALVAYTVFEHWRPDSLRDVIAANHALGDRHRPATGRHARRVLAAFVQAAGAPPRFTVLGDLAALERTSNAYRTALSQEAKHPESGSAASDRLGTRLRQSLWDPIRRLLPGTREIFVVPDGPMLLLSPEAFPAGGGRYLVESGTRIILLDTERDLVSRARVRPAGRGWFALGAPDFERAHVEGRGRFSAAKSAMTRATPSLCDDWTRTKFAPLPGSAAEVLGVQALWRRLRTPADSADGAASCLTGADASEGAFKLHAGGARVVHVATHGFAPERDCAAGEASAQGDPLLRTGLALAGANHPEAASAGGEDGWLTAAEISTLDLSAADCVVLSACNSATGQVRNGEGVFGLRRALALAGARSTVMSLWTIDDLATGRWMQFFYEAHLKSGDSPEVATHRASVSLLRERRAQGRSTSPAFWGAFVSTGAGR